MAEIEIGDAVASGFGLIRHRPLAVLLWGLLYLVGAAAAFALFAPTYLGFLGEVMSQARNHPGAPPNPAAFMGRMMQMQGIGMLVNVGLMVLNAVIYCAVFRAILHPEQSRFGYLRVGAAEMFTVILMVAAYFAFVIGLLIPILVIGIVVGVLAASHAIAAAVIVGVLAAVALFVAMIYIALRFSLVVPMMVDDGRFHLFESWTVTRGKTVSLFIMALSTMMVILVAEVIIGLILLVIGAGILGAAAGGLENLPVFFRQPPPLILSKLVPFLAIYAVVMVPLVGCGFSVMGAPWAKAYRDLVGPDVVAEFT